MSRLQNRELRGSTSPRRKALLASVAVLGSTIGVVGTADYLSQPDFPAFISV